MPQYNFKARFADDVENLVKRQTIRPKRKRPTRAGDTLYLFTGLRTKHCRRLIEVECASVTPIDFYTQYLTSPIRLDGRPLSAQEIDELAAADGFDNTVAFWQFFESTYTLPLIGVMDLIKW